MIWDDKKILTEREQGLIHVHQHLRSDVGVVLYPTYVKTGTESMVLKVSKKGSNSCLKKSKRVISFGLESA